MSQTRFSDEDIQYLSSLSIVYKVTAKMLIFNNKFKQFAISEHLLGKPCNQIFIEAGIDISKFSKKHFYQQIKRWKKEDLATLKPKGRPKKIEKLVDDMNLEELKAKIALQEAEIEFLKKLKALD